MKKLAIFPFQDDIRLLLQFQRCLGEYEISAIATFRENVDTLNKYKINDEILCTSDIREAIDYADELLLGDNIYRYLLNQYKFAIDYAKHCNKKIIMSIKLFKELQLEDTKGIEIIHNNYKEKREIQTSQFYDIPVPIIGIMGLGEDCNKFESQMLCMKVVKEMGYQVETISTNPLGHFCGMNVLPDFLFDTKISFSEKVLLFNHYVYEIYMEKQPDLFIIGFPSGIMSIGKIIMNYFAEIPLIISSAISFDIGFLNIYFTTDLQNGYFTYMRDFCEKKFNIFIDMFFMSTQHLEYDADSLEFEVLHIDEDIIKKMDSSISKTSINIINTDYVEKIIRKKIQMLEDNIQCI